MTYKKMEEFAQMLVLDAMNRDPLNVEDLDEPKFYSFINQMVQSFYKHEGSIMGALLVLHLKDKYNIRIAI